MKKNKNLLKEDTIARFMKLAGTQHLFEGAKKKLSEQGPEEELPPDAAAPPMDAPPMDAPPMDEPPMDMAPDAGPEDADMGEEPGENDAESFVDKVLQAVEDFTGIETERVGAEDVEGEEGLDMAPEAEAAEAAAGPGPDFAPAPPEVVGPPPEDAEEDLAEALTRRVMRRLARTQQKQNFVQNLSERISRRIQRETSNKRGRR